MKALILAAGLGTRLAPITYEVPKSLVPVNGTPIIMKQIDNLHRNDLTDITVISGYKANILERTVHEAYPQVRFIENMDYASTNNMYSAYLARDVIDGNDFLMMNADVFYDLSVITTLLSFDWGNAIVTDIGTYQEESMKVIEKDGRIIRISKQITPDVALGSSIDVYKFSADAGNVFFARCAEYIEHEIQRTLWSEVALNDILQDVMFKACPLNGRWMEIDNHDDLKAAEQLFAEG